MSQNSGITVVLSICVTQTDRLRNCEMFCGDVHSLKPELNSENKKADVQKLLSRPTDSYVLLLLVHYFESLSDEAIEVWNLSGGGDKARYIPVHFLVPWQI